MVEENLNTRFYNAERLDIARNHVVSPQLFPNVLSSSELDELRRRSRSNRPTSYREGLVNVSIEWKDSLTDIIYPKIQSHLSFPCRFGGSFISTLRPLPPHIDGSNNPNEIFIKQFLFPLDFFPDAKQSEIVFYDQFFWGPQGHCLISNIDGQYSDMRAKYLDNYKENESPHGFESCLGFTKGRLSGLTVNKTISYSPGDMLAFNSARLHSSNDFRAHGIVMKTFLLIFAIMDF